jgi:hypothetical protein
MQEFKGVFLQAMSWTIEDENSGNKREGVTVRLAMEKPSGYSGNPLKGYVIQKFTADKTFIGKINEKALTGKLVTLTCDLQPAGNSVKFVPVGIEKAE